MVNVKDIQDMKNESGEDKLDQMFRRQWDLIGKYKEIETKTLPCVVPHSYPVDLDSYHGQHQIKEQIFRTIVELCEAADCLKNKPWKQTMIETDVIHFQEELADALHFFLEVCIQAGIGPDELYQLYFKKSEVNKFRQRSEY